MNLGILGYVPPPSFGHPAAFMANLTANLPKAPMLLYSDSPREGVAIQLKGNPEIARASAPQNKWAVNNFIFFTGLRIALAHGLTHFIYVESDCRMARPGWDEPMWEEFFRTPRPCAIGGTMVTYNPCNSGMEATKRWQDALGKNSRRNFPIATYGWQGASDTGGTSVFVNGALGIYSVAWLDSLFPASELGNSQGLAGLTYAWDFEIGFRLWKMMGHQAYDVVAHLDCMYSGYGEQLTTEKERLEMLHSGRVVAVHQVKSNL